MEFTDLLQSGFGAWSDYNKTKQESAKADQAQLNYQSSLNLASISQNKTVMLGIAGAVAVIVAFFIFKK